MLPTVGGNGPVILFDEKMKEIKFDISPIDDGKLPVRELLDTSKEDNMVSFSNPSGNGPVNWLPNASKMIRKGMSDTPLGRDPEKAFVPR
jgi:hypothetical protein